MGIDILNNSDCDEVSELGRITADSNNNKFYVCMGAAGWKAVQLVNP